MHERNRANSLVANPEKKDDLVYLCKALGHIRIVYDCGSRDALDGLDLLARLEADELHIFECNPDGIRLCKKNIASYSGTGSIFMNELALSDGEGELKFFSIDPERTVTPHPDGNIGASSLFQPDPAYPKERYATKVVQVRATSLDKYCETHRPPDLLWMDLQGAELRLLEGAKRTLPYVKAINLEVTFRRVFKGQPMFYQIHRFLKQKGFSLARLQNVPMIERIVRTYAGRFNRYINVGHWFTNAIYVSKNAKQGR